MAKKARSPALLCPLALGGERLDGAWKGVKSEGENGVLTLLLEKAERIFRQPYGPAGLLFVRGSRVVAANKDYARLRPLPDDNLTAVIDEIRKMARER